MDNSGIVGMLEFQKTEDLERMYKLLCRVALQTIASRVSAHFRQEGKGKALVNAITSGTISGLNFIEVYLFIILFPTYFISSIFCSQSLLSLKDRYDMFLVTNDPIFTKMMSSDLKYFLSLDLKSTEHLSLFIDDKLKKGDKGMTEQDIDLVLDKTMVLFHFLQEKDIFEHYYQQHLAKRLLLNKSVSDDSEKLMLSKLKVIFLCFVEILSLLMYISLE